MNMTGEENETIGENFGDVSTLQHLAVGDIKIEEEDLMMFANFAQSHTNNTVESLNETQLLNSTTDETSSSSSKPAWCPSNKGRSIVWDHIKWLPDSQRAACNYCHADFQIKGGTSALLRHLKTIHPHVIQYDPENPPPITRRKKRKIEKVEPVNDYPMDVSEETKGYVDKLLTSILTDENGLRMMDGTEPSTSPPPGFPNEFTGLQFPRQSRADSEIDEVIRNLQKQEGMQHQTQDLRALLGMSDEAEVVAISGGAELPRNATMDEEKQVSSSSGGGGQMNSNGGKKRKMEESTSPQMMMQAFPGMVNGKMSLSAIQRRPPPSMHHHGPMPGMMPGMVPPGFLGHPGMPPPPSVQLPPGFPPKFNAHTAQIVEFEAKILYNQSMHASIARDNAMTNYYHLKARQMELQNRLLERQLGEQHHQQEVQQQPKMEVEPEMEEAEPVPEEAEPVPEEAEPVPEEEDPEEQDEDLKNEEDQEEEEEDPELDEE